MGMAESDFLTRIADNGGTAYLVGGAVRDRLLHRTAADRDYVVCGLSRNDFLSLFPAAICVGRCFPVYAFVIDDVFCDVSLARTERKTGEGYLGFEIAFSAETTIEEDLSRRDTTMNSIAFNPLTNELRDPYKGAEDIAAKLVRAVSPHFSEDPVRALRAARQAAQFGFTVEEGTLALMSGCGNELAHEPHERIIIETEKALAAPRPSLFFRALDDAGLLKLIFPWIYNLKGKVQPADVHPEGDAFEHAMAVLDYVSERTEKVAVRFAALVHDIGKGETPQEMLPHHSGHEARGIEILKEMDSALGLRAGWRNCASFAIKMHTLRENVITADAIVRLFTALRKNPIGCDGFSLIVAADNHGKVPEFLLHADDYWRVIDEAAAEPFPPQLEDSKRSMWRRRREVEAVQNFRAAHGLR